MALFRLCNVLPIRLVVLTQPVIDVSHVADIDDLLQAETHVRRNVHSNNVCTAICDAPLLNNMFVRRSSCKMLTYKSHTCMRAIGGGDIHVELVGQ